jgi:putative membrane protein
MHNFLILFVALSHIGFCILEMFLWTRPIGLKIFHNKPERAEETKVLAANQGLYNFFLAAGLLWGLFSKNLEFSFQIKLFFLSCIFVAGIYGAFTANKKIFFIQALPALIALVFLLIK